MYSKTGQNIKVELKNFSRTEKQVKKLMFNVKILT